MKKTGVLLLNLGGPRNLKEVRPFLYHLFSDPAILVGVPSPLRQLIAYSIALLKGHSSIKNYQALGGSSPIHHWTTLQAESLERVLNAGEKGVFKVVVGMRIGTPSIASALTELHAWGATQIIFLPLFPQFSTTTTLSCFKEADRVLKKLKWDPQIFKINSFEDHPLYISLLRRTIEESLETSGPDTYLVYSAHSLPISIVKRGDPYPLHVDKTVRALSKALVNSKAAPTLAFQSRNGRLPWLEPYLEDEIERLAREGVKKIVAVPISFVSDHIETLWELDIFYTDIAKKLGFSYFARTKAFNDDPRFVEVLKSLCAEAMGQPEINL